VLRRRASVEGVRRGDGQSEWAAKRFFRTAQARRKWEAAGHLPSKSTSKNNRMDLYKSTGKASSISAGVDDGRSAHRASEERHGFFVEIGAETRLPKISPFDLQCPAPGQDSRASTPSEACPANYWQCHGEIDAAAADLDEGPRAFSARNWSRSPIVGHRANGIAFLCLSVEVQSFVL